MLIQQLKFPKFMVFALVGLICASALGVGEAWAIKLLAKTDGVAKTFTDSSDHVVLTRKITLSKKGQVVIIYTAECSVNALDTVSWLDIDIRVNGTAVAPTDGDDAFCTSSGSGSLDGWVSAATQIRAVLPAGVHTIEIVGALRVFTACEQWRIDDQSLNIIIQKN